MKSFAAPSLSSLRTKQHETGCLHIIKRAKHWPGLDAYRWEVARDERLTTNQRSSATLQLRAAKSCHQHPLATQSSLCVRNVRRQGNITSRSWTAAGSNCGLIHETAACLSPWALGKGHFSQGEKQPVGASRVPHTPWETESVRGLLMSVGVSDWPSRSAHPAQRESMGTLPTALCACPTLSK